MSPRAARFPVRVVALLLSGESLPDASRCVLSAVLARRMSGPQEGLFGLPGALLSPGESLDAAAMRALAEVGVKRPRAIRQLNSQNLGAEIVITYLATIDQMPAASRHDLAIEVIPLADLTRRGPRIGNLQSEDAQMVKQSIHAFRQLLGTTPIALDLVPAVFTLAQLRSIYEAAWGKSLDVRNFRRSLLEGQKPFVEPVGESLSHRGTRGRPPELYQATRAWDQSAPIQLPRRSG